jgi:hypothetical protein
MDSFDKRNTSSGDRRRSKQKPVEHFLRNLFSSTDSSSGVSIEEDLLEVILPVWDRTIVPALHSEFGNVATLYAIFYAPDVPEAEIILEVWDPRYVDRKPAQLFRFRGMSDVAMQLPRSRAEAEVLRLENWHLTK